MRKYIWVLSALIIPFIFLGCTGYSANKNERVTEKVEQSITVYEITGDQYLTFLELPSIDYLKSVSTIHVYSVDENHDKTMIKKKADATTFTEYSAEGVFRISYIPVWKSLIDFWSDRSKVQQYLESNDIWGNIEEIVFLSSYEFPCTIGICADSEWCFVTINEYDEDCLQDPHDDSFVYRIYTHHQTAKKFAIGDADVFVDEKRVFSVKMRYDDAKIPIVSLFQYLGADIQWYKDAVKIVYEDKCIQIDTISQSIHFPNDTIYCDPPGGEAHFSVVGAEIYLDMNTTADVLRELNIEMTWSCQEHKVWVKKIHKNTKDDSVR